LEAPFFDRRLCPVEKARGVHEAALEDAAFRDFVLSAELRERTDKLAEALKQWKRADMTSAAGRALAYLPAGAAIRVKVYPVIKPKTNSFVFELQTDPAISLNQRHQNRINNPSPAAGASRFTQARAPLT